MYFLNLIAKNIVDINNTITYLLIDYLMIKLYLYISLRGLLKYVAFLRNLKKK